ncbi:MAG TPA: hypothetical protein PLO93_01165 [Candidatus Omnitrophota bacterium]|nr:hypothetical protein [Candidatus Omnitrophota bacterium]HQL40889.1 hypothetical protein [Candidatus Omnitrophota bacterium]
MKKILENKNLLILAAVSIGCLVISLVSSQKFQRTRDDLNQERYNRMVAEEMMEKMKSKVRILEADVKKFQAEAEKANALLQRKEGAVAELKLELEKTERLNQVLQEQLKSALVQQK